MNTLRAANFTSALAVTLSLLGCATPQPVLDLASRGAGAVSLAETELQRYLAGAQDQLATRALIVRQLSIAEIEEKYRDSLDRPNQEQADIIRKLGEERRRKREAKDAEIAKVEDRHKKALVPVILRADEFTNVKKAFSTLAEELSPQEWLNLALEYVRQVRDSVKQIREDAKASEKLSGSAGNR